MNEKKTQEKFSVKSMVFIAIMAALICIAGPISIPMPGLVPISLAPFAVYLAGSLLGTKKGVVAVVIYILIGMVGLPVFSGFTGGIAKLLGITGGYIIGYIPCVLLTGIFADKFPHKIWALPVGMVLGTVSCYIFGTAWFIVTTGSTLAAALLSCVVPFLIGDAIKIVAATAISFPLKSKLSAFLSAN